MHTHDFELMTASTYCVSQTIELLYKCRCGEIKVITVNAKELLKDK